MTSIRLPRFTTRRLMIAVFFAALVLASTAEVLRLLGKRDLYRRLAAMHDRGMADEIRYDSQLYRTKGEYETEGRTAAPMPGDAARYLLAGGPKPPTRWMIGYIDEQRRKGTFRWEWHKRLKENYERAALYPWAAVEPDMPQPR